MKKMRNIIFALIILIIVISITSCEELFPTISGIVSNGGNPVSGTFVLALNADTTAYVRLSRINELSVNALATITDVVRGFDSATDGNGDYSATLLSGGTVYIVAIDDDGSGNLDSLDLVGWFGDLDSIKILNPYTGIDSIYVSYIDPGTVTIEDGADTTGIGVEYMIQYWLLELVQEYLK